MDSIILIIISVLCFISIGISIISINLILSHRRYIIEQLPRNIQRQLQYQLNVIRHNKQSPRFSSSSLPAGAIQVGQSDGDGVTNVDFKDSVLNIVSCVMPTETTIKGIVDQQLSNYNLGPSSVAMFAGINLTSLITDNPQLLYVSSEDDGNERGYNNKNMTSPSPIISKERTDVRARHTTHGRIKILDLSVGQVPTIGPLPQKSLRGLSIGSGPGIVITREEKTDTNGNISDYMFISVDPSVIDGGTLSSNAAIFNAMTCNVIFNSSGSSNFTGVANFTSQVNVTNPTTTSLFLGGINIGPLITTDTSSTRIYSNGDIKIGNNAIGETKITAHATNGNLDMQGNLEIGGSLATQGTATLHANLLVPNGVIIAKSIQVDQTLQSASAILVSLAATTMTSNTLSSDTVSTSDGKVTIENGGRIIIEDAIEGKSLFVHTTGETKLGTTLFTGSIEVTEGNITNLHTTTTTTLINSVITKTPYIELVNADDSPTTSPTTPNILVPGNIGVAIDITGGKLSRFRDITAAAITATSVSVTTSINASSVIATSITATNDIQVAGSVTAGSVAAGSVAAGSVTLSGDITATAGTIAGNEILANSAGVGGVLQAGVVQTGTLTSTGNIAAGGSIAAAGSIDSGGTLTAAAIACNSTVTAAGNISSGGSGIFAGSLHAGSGLITGTWQASTLSVGAATISAATITTNATIGGNAIVSGTLDVGSTIETTSNVIANDVHTGNSVVSDAIIQSGESLAVIDKNEIDPQSAIVFMASALGTGIEESTPFPSIPPSTIPGSIFFNRTIMATMLAKFNRLFVQRDLIINESLTCAGNASVAGNLTVNNLSVTNLSIDDNNLTVNTLNVGTSVEVGQIITTQNLHVQSNAIIEGLLSVEGNDGNGGIGTSTLNSHLRVTQTLHAVGSSEMQADLKVGGSLEIVNDGHFLKEILVDGLGEFLEDVKIGRDLLVTRNTEILGDHVVRGLLNVDNTVSCRNLVCTTGGIISNDNITTIGSVIAALLSGNALMISGPSIMDTLSVTNDCLLSSASVTGNITASDGVFESITSNSIQSNNINTPTMNATTLSSTNAVVTTMTVGTLTITESVSSASINLGAGTGAVTCGAITCGAIIASTDTVSAITSGSIVCPSMSASGAGLTANVSISNTLSVAGLSTMNNHVIWNNNTFGLQFKPTVGSSMTTIQCATTDLDRTIMIPECKTSTGHVLLSCRVLSTQTGNITTAVTCHGLSGRIMTVSNLFLLNSTVTFVMNNSALTTSSHVIVGIDGGTLSTNTSVMLSARVGNIGTGQCNIYLSVFGTAATGTISVSFLIL